MYPLTFTLDPDGSVISHLIMEHLSNPMDKMKKYFSSINIEQYDWVRNLYTVSEEYAHGLPLHKAEKFVQLQTDQSLQLKHKEIFHFCSSG